MFSSASAAPAPTLGTMNLKLRLLVANEKQRMAVLYDVTAQESLDGWSLDGDILTIKGTLDRVKVLEALDKHKKLVVVQRIAGS